MITRKTHQRDSIPTLLRWRILQRQSIVLAMIVVVSALPFLVSSLSRSLSPSRSAVRKPQEPARLSDTVSVHVSDSGGDNTINLSDGHQLLTSYVGPEELRLALAQNEAEPLSLASDDFDEDGVPDLVSGYAYKGQGIVSLLRGNVDSIYPNTSEATKRKANGTFTEAAFLSPAQVFEAPAAADFLGTGDFDADGHSDVVIAARTGKALYFLSGDGRGGLALTRKVPLPGAATAMIAGEINRPDGLTDIVIGVYGQAGSQVLVFEGPEGALRAIPEEFDLPATPTAIALGQFDGPSENELVIAAGAELVVIYGRDRKLSLNATEQSKVAPATIGRRAMPYLITGLAAGDFIWDEAHETDLALLAPDGQVHFLARNARASMVPLTHGKSHRGRNLWLEQRVVSSPSTLLQSRSATNRERLLVSRARVSGHQTDDLLLLNSERQSILVVNSDPAQRNQGGALLRERDSAEPTTTALNVASAPVAILPMRLNRAAVNGLVVLLSGETAPAIMPSTSHAIITVNSSDDTNFRDKVLTLREAILLAEGGTSATQGLSKAELTPLEQAQVERTPGANQLDEIRFNIPAAQGSAINFARAVGKETDESLRWQSVNSLSSIYLAEDNHPTMPSISHDIASAQLFPTAPFEGEGFTQPNVSTSSTPIQTVDANIESLSQSSITNAQLMQMISPNAFSCTTPSFGAPKTIRLGTGAYPFSVAIGDFNRDGKPDVVTANQSPFSITVRLGNGAGGFEPPTTSDLGPGAGKQVYVAIGDFNRDGSPDLVAANNTSKITVLLGNGAGGFGTPKAFSLGGDVSSPNSVAVGDFNGDGTPDVVTASSGVSSNVTVLLGKGGGDFGTPNTIILGAGVTSPNSLALGDFDGDAKLDVVTANTTSKNITVLLGNGAGGFGTPKTFDLSGNEPQSVAIGDFNGDGKPDVVTANNANSIALLLGNGAGDLGLATTYGLGVVGSGAHSVAIGDFNGDGNKDVVTANYNSNNITMLPGNGSGGFGLPATFTLGAGVNSPNSVAVGDFSGDGKPDVVTANVNSNNITLLLGDVAGGFGNSSTFDLSSGGIGPLSFVIGDFNSDDNKDVVTANQNSNNLSLLLGNAAGGLGTPNTLGLGGVAIAPNRVATADFNGDFKPDLVTANLDSNNITLLLNNGSGSFGTPTAFSQTAGVGAPFAIAIGYFNEDNNADVVTANQSSNSITLFLGNGAGGFGTEPTTFDLGVGINSPSSLAVGDFTRDGNNDVVTANINSNNITLLPGNGSGGFGRARTLELGADAIRPNAIAVGFFDENNNPDLVTANFISNNITVLLGNFAGGFGPPTTISLGAGANPIEDQCCSGPSVAIGDVNGDGKQDVVVAIRYSNTITALLGNGVGGFGPPKTFSLGAGVSEPYSVGIGDLNRDDKPDVLTGNLGSNNVAVLLSTCGSGGLGPDLTLSKSHVGNFTVGNQGVFRLTVTNVGTSSTTGAITLTDNLPAGLSFVAGAGNGSTDNGWNCIAAGQNVTCTNSWLLLPTTTTTLNLTVNASQAAASVTNTATVTTPGDANGLNNTASDATMVGVPCAPQPINIGQTINGALSTTDCFSPLNPNSPYADRYTFVGTAGQPIAISLSSLAFDSFLYLIGPDGTVIGSDDDGGGGTNSRILAGDGFFILPTNGTYTIEATSLRSNQTGNYTLSLTTGTPTCTYRIAPTSQAFSAAGGGAKVTITTPGNCPWTATSNSRSFITINSGLNGTGTGAVTFTVAANSTNTTRTGTLTIAGQTFTVTQAAGDTCFYSINPTSQSFPAVGGSGATSVTAPNGCGWTVTKNASFILVNGGGGSGNGTARFTVIANTSPTIRTGTLTIAGQTFTVVQEGSTANIFTINLVSPLPKIMDAVIIDGATQPGFSGTPLVVINGSGLGNRSGGNAGLSITAGNSTVRSLTITGFASGNRDKAVFLITNGGNVVEGCYVGTDASGTRSFGQSASTIPRAAGISIESSSGNRIGGTTTAARNLISGIDGDGIIIRLSATNNLVQGNYIGTDVTGSVGLTFQHIGVHIQGANGNTIGGQPATPGTPPGNLISGNFDYGVFLEDDSLNNLVAGNLIGSNTTGTVSVPNGNAGIFVKSTTGAGGQLNNTIGGTAPTARNIISGNDSYGVVLGVGATNTLVQGNYIGTKVDGASALPNNYGITATQATGSTIGGGLDAARNVISGNIETGVGIGFLDHGQLGGTGTTIQRNYIGTNAAGTRALGNQGDGVFVEVQSITHKIQENIIAHNGKNGVRIPNITDKPGGTPGVRIQIVDNSINSNAKLGIDLGDEGITLNDPLDADGGANLQQNFPVLTSVTSSLTGNGEDAVRSSEKRLGANTINVNGTLNSKPNSTFTIHWYFNAAAQCPNNQATNRLLPPPGRVPNVMTDANGNASFVFPFDFPPGITSGVINCTATDSDGNTSEFSACFAINANPGTWQPVMLTAAQIELKDWTVGGRTYVYVKPTFPDAGYRVVNWGQWVKSNNDFNADASVEKFTGASIQSVVTTAQIYNLGPLANGTYNFNFRTSGTLAKTLAFTVSSTVPPPNLIDNARGFVRQQYLDFLNRKADQAGEDFWTDNIAKCSDPARRPAGQTVDECTTRQRETTSAAFFLSPEFQDTGYYVYRMYKGALGRQPNLLEFTPDAQFVGNGIVVNEKLSAAKINQNKADFAAQFINCTDATKYRCGEFKAIYDGLSNQQYVDKLFLTMLQTAGVNASASDKAALVSGLSASPATETRATVLQKVVDGINVISEGNKQFTTTYGEAFYNAEFNRAFVLLEYFGYMKRDPDDAGYAFWLDKLNLYGTFDDAEMVLSFIRSHEYRARFGQP